MYLAALEQPGHHHHNKNHLVFVVVDAESHGLTRIPPEPFSCQCGVTLAPGVLDEGDESKSSWPNCKSWRDGGRKKCPECDEYPSIERDQHIRARGYQPTPKDDIKNITSKQREEALERTDGLCTLCENGGSYVIRVVPPRYGGNREPKNLAPLCEHHYTDYGHMFADLLQPEEWYQIKEFEWEGVASEFRDRYEAAGHDKFVSVLDELLERGQQENPYPYIDV